MGFVKDAVSGLFGGGSKVRSAGAGARVGGMFGPAGAVAGGVLGGIFGGGGEDGQPMSPEEIAQFYDPLRPQRMDYAQQLQALMQDPSMISESPAYQARLEAGTEAVTGTHAARGLLGSGALPAALHKYGQREAASEFDRQVARLSQLAGFGFAPTMPGGVRQEAQAERAAGQQAEVGAIADLIKMGKDVIGKNSAIIGGGIGGGA